MGWPFSASVQRGSNNGPDLLSFGRTVGYVQATDARLHHQAKGFCISQPGGIT